MRNRFHIVLGAIIVAFIAIAVYLVMQQPETKHSLSYLALGDSYTIGYKVRYADNYPNQVAGFLRGKHFDIGDPSIIAYPGWTTNDLAKAISEKGVDQRDVVMKRRLGKTTFFFEITGEFSFDTTKFIAIVFRQ